MSRLIRGVVAVATIVCVFGDDIVRYVAGLRNAIVRGQRPDDEDNRR